MATNLFAGMLAFLRCLLCVRQRRMHENSYQSESQARIELYNERGWYTQDGNEWHGLGPRGWRCSSKGRLAYINQ